MYGVCNRQAKRTLMRSLFAVAGGILTVASFAWACVAHEEAGDGPELTVTGPPPTGSTTTHAALEKGVLYTWTADWSGAAPSKQAVVGDDYEIRVAKHEGLPQDGVVGSTNRCGGVMQSNSPWHETTMVSGSPTSATGSISDTSQIPSAATEGEIWDACIFHVGSSTARENGFKFAVL